MKLPSINIATVLGLVLFCLSLSAGNAVGSDDYTKTGMKKEPQYTIAVMPFANYSGESKAEELFIPTILNRIDGKEFKVIGPTELRPTLRKYRIRPSGTISAADAAIIADELKVDFLLLGSFDIFIENDIPEAGFSMRLLDIENMRLFWAASEAASGNDFTGLFGIGQIKQTDKLVHRLVKKAFKKFDKHFNAYIKEKVSTPPAAPIFAMVTFDNLSGRRYAGEIMSNILLTELISRGKIVVEPGTVRELLRSRNSAPRGGIDHELMSELQRSLGVDFVLTGSVNHFKPGIAGVESAAPEIEFGGRCLDSESGRIIAAYEYYRLGSDSDALLSFGSPRALGKLSQKVINDFLNKLDKDLN